MILRPAAGIRRGQQRLDQPPLGASEIEGAVALARHPSMLAIFLDYDCTTGRPLSPPLKHLIPKHHTPSVSSIQDIADILHIELQLAPSIILDVPRQVVRSTTGRRH
ncbi:hypothetical protein Misp02_57890 [Microtetraspora sp. NBRC 16547]|nr:hypothetical protein Misp02_57890 [Microtetraspora sp. NBRC 16547]